MVFDILDWLIQTTIVSKPKPVESMKVVQILPELNAGGVERGTLEVGKRLVQLGHDSVVISNGGRLVEQLEEEGSCHVTLPIQKKRLSSLRQAGDNGPWILLSQCLFSHYDKG